MPKKAPHLTARESVSWATPLWFILALGLGHARTHRERKISPRHGRGRTLVTGFFTPSGSKLTGTTSGCHRGRIGRLGEAMLKRLTLTAALLVSVQASAQGVYQYPTKGEVWDT